jgi:membrane-bound ClpP family serine protease
MVKINGKDVPVVQAEVITTIKNKQTGAVYKTDEEWKALSVPSEQIQRDVLVKIPKLDLLAKTK